MPVLTLTTDFGTSDGYVAAMKAVALARLPTLTLVDIGHQVPPQDVLAGALLLESAAPLFPAGTVHLAVVDPGVGSPRRAVAVRTARHVYVGPDNGLFTLVLDQDPPLAQVELDNPIYHRHPLCPTFHGRDLFAPVAAQLAAGVPLEDLGSPVATLVRLSLPVPVARPDALELHVLHVDHFGNLVLDLDTEAHARWRAAHPGLVERFTLAGRRVDGVARTFSDVGPGALVVYPGSSGRLEVGVRNGNAAAVLGLRRGEPVALQPR